MSLIVDASVAVRWYLPEPGSEEAERILAAGQDLLAPELVIAELGNAVSKRVRKQEVSSELAIEIMHEATKAFSGLIPLAGLAPRAMLFATRYGHSIYDCFYVALAHEKGGTLVTADRKLASVAGRCGVAVEVLR
jgi:predicted nucleic acid-binding protein